ncbi:4'-phosphopantetheinyl transferase superfamily protein [Herbaspirillum sp. RTI4]|uniref:4'-phosphopantetheinyl transferase family protein n=1 Tax=Herbaspirillum sp. RTI4 TaxID=3048640 RepID=UPI002AB4349B|nr:4'-phosphopantetheinyl transferase superfamily protein [Herbaspirillum sp. RTI4]MDY7578919.1 4'-phosphopantetheinyl transferase superfamily protein [Herbaspirillum sp. RTI4]MEA9982008.1 4'-phosphopantetheinyl transferase superfamily protein [Herbaspirillum sp. RTI4]
MSQNPAPCATLWLVDGNAIPAGQWPQQAVLLGVSEQQRLASFVRPRRAQEFLLGRLLLRHAIAALENIDPASITVIEQAGQAPALSLPLGCTAPHFSLAHSQAWVACVVSATTTVGLDIEMPRAGRDIEAISRSAFAPQEHAWLMQQTAAARAGEFYRLWTAKEARFKLHGTGLRQAIIDEKGEFLLAQAAGAAWHCTIPPHPLLSVCVCSDQAVGADQPLKRIELPWQALLTRPPLRESSEPS